MRPHACGSPASKPSSASLALTLVYDLSATPFFLRGSGYIEGTLFPWTMSDFSLMDAIECGIVKLPRVPVADNVPGGDTPKFRDLWEQLKASPRKLPKKGRTAGKAYDPLELTRPANLGAGGALRPLREDLQALGGGRHQRSAGVDRRVQQHIDIRDRLQVHLRDSPREG